MVRIRISSGLRMVTDKLQLRIMICATDNEAKCMNKSSAWEVTTFHNFKYFIPVSSNKIRWLHKSLQNPQIWRNCD